MRFGWAGKLLAALAIGAQGTDAAPPPDPTSQLTARIAALPALLSEPGRYEDAFTPAFKAAVPALEWKALLAKFGSSAGKPLAIERVSPLSPWSAKVRVRYERALIGTTITVDAAPPHAIAGLHLAGPVSTEETAEAVLEAIAALPGEKAVAIARIGDGAPALLHRLFAHQPMAVGSEFKLIVLAELIRAIEAGERRWEDVATLDGKPLPGGRYASQPAGTKATLRDLARAMISVSDNSAADILIDTLGRDRIEALLPQVGIARPAEMRPFLKVLEAFRLKAMIADGETEWLAADEAERRRLLAGPVATFPPDRIDSAFAGGKPLSIESVEWHTSPQDMVRLLDWIRRHTESGPAAEARAILAENPGVAPDAAAVWDYVGYKGGSEPGVIALSLLLRSKGGDWFAVSTAWNDPARPVDNERFVALVGRLIELLGLLE